MVDGAIPEHGDGRVVPMDARSIEGSFIPIEGVTDAALRQKLDRFLLGNESKPLGDEVMRIPKLTGTLVGDSGEGAAAGRAPVGRKDGLPNNEDANLLFGVVRENLLYCGRPPQTFGSSGREKKK